MLFLCFRESERTRERLNHDFKQALHSIQLFGRQCIEQCMGLPAFLIAIRFHKILR